MEESIKKFIKAITRGQYGSKRQRRRLMQREIKRLQKNDAKKSNGVDGKISRRHEGRTDSPRDDKG